MNEFKIDDEIETNDEFRKYAEINLLSVKYYTGKVTKVTPAGFVQINNGLLFNPDHIHIKKALIPKCQ